MRVVATVRDEEALRRTAHAFDDRVELGRQAVLVIGALDREHRGGDAGEAIGNRPCAPCRSEPGARPAGEQGLGAGTVVPFELPAQIALMPRADQVRDAAQKWLEKNRSVTGYLIKDATPKREEKRS